MCVGEEGRSHLMKSYEAIKKKTHVRKVPMGYVHGDTTHPWRTFDPITHNGCALNHPLLIRMCRKLEGQGQDAAHRAG